MESLLWLVGALILLATIERALRRPDRIDWRSRAALGALSIATGFVFDLWIRTATLNAAEWSASLGKTVSSVATTIAPYYDPILFPVYVCVLAILIDQAARLVARTRRFEDRDMRRRQLWRAATANSAVFVGVPALLYMVASPFANNDSILGEAAQASLAPALKGYGALSYLLVDRWGSAAAWYRTHSYWSGTGYEFASLISFIHDAAPWLALAIIGTCIEVLRNPTADARTLRQYFGNPDPNRSARSFGAFGTWRLFAAAIFTLAWVSALSLSMAFVYLVAALPYVLLWLAVFIVIGAVVFAAASRTSK